MGQWGTSGHRPSIAGTYAEDENHGQQRAKRHLDRSVAGGSKNLVYTARCSSAAAIRWCWAEVLLPGWGIDRTDPVRFST